MSITILGPKESPSDSKFPFFVNTTSRSSTDLGRAFSPFFLGPCKLYPDAVCTESKTMENAWQYSKVYKKHISENGWPNEAWKAWAKLGFENTKAVRYPMGRGAVPEFSYWNGERFSYTEARKHIYLPLYMAAVNKDAFLELCKLYETYRKLFLWDFDGYNRKFFNMSPDDVLNSPDRKMGHAFVIERMLLDHFGGELT